MGRNAIECLVTSRLAAIEGGEQVVVGVNRFVETAPSPLSTGEGLIQTVDEAAEREQIGRLQAWRDQRDGAKAELLILRHMSRARSYWSEVLGESRPTADSPQVKVPRKRIKRS